MKPTEPAKVSVIIPVYNIEAFIAKCLDSIVRQDYSRLEIIIDDGSSDKTGGICDEYAGMIRRMVTVAVDHDADLVCCGKYLEYENKSVKEPLTKIDTVVIGNEIVLKFKQGYMLETVWNKLWRRDLFGEDIIFPVGHVYEDIATVWKLVIKSKTAVFLRDSYYHYLQREGSVSHDLSGQLR